MGDIKEVDKKLEEQTRNFRFNPDAWWTQNPTAKLLRGFKRQTSRRSSELVDETAAPSEKLDGALTEPNSGHKAKEASSSLEKNNGAGKQPINLKRDDSKENVWTLPRWEPNSKKTAAKSANKGCLSPSNPSTPVEPSSPSTPVEPSNPLALIEPSNPSTPVEPSTPSTPVERSHDVSGFREPKSPKFSGTPRQSKGKLSTGEAQATLMRLASAGRAVDLDEVRRLRKLLCEEWDRKS